VREGKENSSGRTKKEQFLKLYKETNTERRIMES
jgi:hypothetical protein